MKCIFTLVLCYLMSFTCFGQEKNIENLDKDYFNWFNKDLKLDHIMGTSVEKAYQLLLKDMKPKKTVIVAVIDGGVDIHHMDLAGKIWVNTGEIPGNGIDDDHNGYVDDVNGWNFIGNKSGENIENENFEYTRIVKIKDEKDPDYKKSKELYDTELNSKLVEKGNIENFEAYYNKLVAIIKDKTGVNVISGSDLKKVRSKDKDVVDAKDFLQKRFAMGFKPSSLDAYKKRNSECLEYFLNLNYNPRPIAGDDPLNLKDNHYGNNDVVGPRSEHGTMCSGIIAANRDNGIGINGIATNVKIMVLRTTPNGDERDKDIALAIMYAVDNGADIINMSFGKKFSPQKAFVDSAVRYAEKHHVLLIHAAGNENANVDEDEYFPSVRYINRTEATNWLNVGASAKNRDKTLPAEFSNYGKKYVDIFAPGVDIISLDTMNCYNMESGTSFSAPVTTGIAALILSYYPKLTPEQMIKLLCESALKVEKPRKVLKPGAYGSKREKVKFMELSKCGGIINAYNALQLAKEQYGNQ